MKKRPYRKPTITNLSMPTAKAEWVPKDPEFTPKGICYTGTFASPGLCGTGEVPQSSGLCFSGLGDTGGNYCFAGNMVQ